MSDRYFKRRARATSSGFEEDYWGKIVDPDGKIRDRREERHQFLEDAAEEVAFLESLTPGKILDIGCGLGFLLSGLGEEWTKFGVEVSQYAARYASEWGTIHNGELPDAGYDTEFFDVVVMHHVIEHMPDPLEQLREVFRVLRRGGRVVFATPDFDSGCARRFGEHYRLLHDDTHVSLFTADSVHRLLRDMGFVVDRVDYPYFNTRHFSRENLLRLFDTGTISPPFYGNFMSFYAHKPVCCETIASLQELGVCGQKELAEEESSLGSLVAYIAGEFVAGRQGLLDCHTGGAAFQALAVELFESPLVEQGFRVLSCDAQPDNGGGNPLRISLVGPPSATGSDQSGADVTIEPEGRRADSEAPGRVIRYPLRHPDAWREPALLIAGALARDIGTALKDNNRIETQEKSSNL